MGKRGEIFSSKLVKDRRSYFFNVHENFGNSISLSIVESKNTTDENVFHRQSILIFQEDLDDFLREMQKAVNVIRQEKSKPVSEGDDMRSSSGFGREFRVDEINKKPSFEREGFKKGQGFAARRENAEGIGSKPAAKPKATPKRRIIIRKPKDE